MFLPLTRLYLNLENNPLPYADDLCHVLHTSPALHDLRLNLSGIDGLGTTYEGVSPYQHPSTPDRTFHAAPHRPVSVLPGAVPTLALPLLGDSRHTLRTVVLHLRHTNFVRSTDIHTLVAAAAGLPHAGRVELDVSGNPTPCLLTLMQALRTRAPAVRGTLAVPGPHLAVRVYGSVGSPLVDERDEWVYEALLRGNEHVPTDRDELIHLTLHEGPLRHLTRE